MKFPDITIVPLSQCLAHEGVVPRWVDEIATNLLDEGVMKNPIVVTKTKRRGKRVVIDGMHRFAALQQLDIPTALVYEIDYDDPAIQLAGWDALTFRPFRAKAFLTQLFGKDRGYTVERTASAEAAQAAVRTREAVLAAGDRHGTFSLLCPRKPATVEACTSKARLADDVLDAQGFRPVYVADSLSIADFHQTRATGILFRTHYTKEEIIERTLAGKLFPRKSTRHLIPRRPLRVDIGIPVLRAKISLDAKNALLAERLRWCYEADRVRYYPESVFIFAD